MMYDGGWGMGGFGLLWVFGGLIFLVVVVVLVVWAVMYLGRTNRPSHGQWAAPPPVPPTRPEPLDILRERFARGDITLEEFETAKRALGYPSSSAPPPGPGTPPTG